MPRDTVQQPNLVRAPEQSVFQLHILIKQINKQKNKQTNKQTKQNKTKKKVLLILLLIELIDAAGALVYPKNVLRIDLKL